MPSSSASELTELTWKSWLVLALFLATILFVIHPVRVRIADTAAEAWGYAHLNVDMKSSPWISILVLLASTAIEFRSEVVHGFLGSNGIEPYAIVVLIFSLAYICISLDQSGLLRYIALYVTRRWGKSGIKLLLSFFALSAVMAGLTSNDVVVLCLTPIICYFSDVTEVDPEPYLIAMFVAANTASMALYIGNPTNIIVAQANSISFFVYSAWMLLPFVGAAVSGAAALYMMSKKSIPSDIAVDIDAQPRDALVRPLQAIIGASVLVLCLVTLGVASFFGVAVWMVTLPFGLAMLVIDIALDMYATRQLSNDAPANASSVLEMQPPGGEKPSADTAPEPAPAPADISVGSWLTRCTSGISRRLPTISAASQRLPYAIAPFSTGMFIIVESLSASGWTPRLAWLLKQLCPSVVPAIFGIGLVSALACSVLNNLPMTILFTRAMMHPIFVDVGTRAHRGALFALIVGSNLGANFSLVGSLAGLMFQSITIQKNRKIGYMRFMRWCVPILPIQLAVSCAILAAEMAAIK
ncbi:hypothetical protein GQ54DRAFT_254914 [Martensiomyces pterosporus]|nr:hypothetical protein GQ54DRAFT_254914 [Martensiomyces pterosporus]